MDSSPPFAIASARCWSSQAQGAAANQMYVRSRSPTCQAGMLAFAIKKVPRLPARQATRGPVTEKSDAALLSHEMAGTTPCRGETGTAPASNPMRSGSGSNRTGWVSARTRPQGAGARSAAPGPRRDRLGCAASLVASPHAGVQPLRRGHGRPLRGGLSRCFAPRPGMPGLCCGLPPCTLRAARDGRIPQPIAELRHRRMGQPAGSDRFHAPPQAHLQRHRTAERPARRLLPRRA